MWCMQPGAVVGQWSGEVGPVARTLVLWVDSGPGEGGLGARTLGLWVDNGPGAVGEPWLSLFIR